MTEEPIVCWLAYYTDYSEMVVFIEEIDALRYAVEHNMQCKALRNGVEFGP